MTSPRERLTETLRWLCDIPSFTGEEGALCDAVAARLRDVDLAEPVRRYENSLVVPVSRGTGKPHLALAGHFDVVRTSHDGPVRVEDDNFFGPGASDMKAGLAIMLDLLEYDLALCRAVDLTLFFYSKEEGPFADNELGPVLDAEAKQLGDISLAVCLEPSDNRLSLGAVGSLHAGVTFSGRTAHSARPWQGDNAIHKAGTFLSDLAALEPRVVEIDGHVYRTVTTATLAEGGRGRNVVPDEFVININHRFAADQTIEEAQADVERLVAGRAEVAWRDLSPAAPPHAHHPLVEALIASGVAGVESKQAWTDVARFAQLGVPAVNFGPGIGAQAHQRNEYTSLTKLDDGRKIFARWIARVGEVGLD